MLAVIDHRTPKHICNAITEHGFDLLPLPSHPSLPTPVAAHPDMLLFFARDRILCTREYYGLAKNELSLLSKAAMRPVVCVEENVSDRYPDDVLLNAAIVGDCILCLPEATSRAILSEHGRRICPVRQGYAKCSTLPVGDRALITADPSIARTSESAGLDTLQISPAHIALKGYDTGFLGGATSYAPYQAMREIFFCGDWRTHPNANEIEAFLNKHQKRPISFSTGELTDVGTVFLI